MRLPSCATEPRGHAAASGKLGARARANVLRDGRGASQLIALANALTAYVFLRR